jgi:hypothetical protein
MAAQSSLAGDDRRRRGAEYVGGGVQAYAEEADQVRPGTFEIVVGASLSPALAAAFDGFTVSRTARGETCLIGWIDDQARLNGVLELIGDLTIELVSVNRVA